MQQATLSTRLLFLASCSILIGATALEAADWPRFRGPNGTGIADDKDIPVQWTAQNILWKTPIPGTGNSSPIVWKDRLYVQSADFTNRILICISTTDGKVIWNKTVPGGQAKYNKLNTMASSTPATDGERIYAYFWDGVNVAVHGFDMKGNHLWEYDLGKWAGNHGPGVSPSVYDGIVYLLNDQGSEFGDPGAKSQVLALNASTGKLVWKADRKPFRACYPTPFMYDNAGQKELIISTTGGLTGYDPKTGKVIWNWDWVFDGMPLRTVGSPVIGDGLVFAGSGDGGGARHMVAVKLGGKGDVSKTHLAWEEKKSLPYVPSMLFWKGHLYTVNDKGRAGCYVAQTGKEVWTQSLGGGFSASPVLIDGKIYAVSDNGSVHVFAAEPTFKLLAKNTVGEPVSATPAVADNRLYIRSKTTLFCIGKK